MKALKTKLLAMATCLLVACLVLAGCGGGESKQDYDKIFSGTWVAVSVGDMTEDDLAQLRQFGLEIVLEMNDDHTLKVTIPDEEDTNGTWEAKSETEAIINVDGDSLTATLADKRLTFEQDGTVMSFARPDDAALPKTTMGMTGATANGDAESEDVNATFGDDNVTITVTRKAIDSGGDPSLYFVAENKLDRDVYLTLTDGSGTINGVTYDAVMATTIAANDTQTDEDYLWFKSPEGVTTLADFTNVKLSVEVWDDATNETLGTFEISVN